MQNAIICGQLNILSPKFMVNVSLDVRMRFVNERMFGRPEPYTQTYMFKAYSKTSREIAHSCVQKHARANV